jgi:hypothetical protein
MSVCYKFTVHMSISKRLVHIEQELNGAITYNQRVRLQDQYSKLQKKQSYQRRPRIHVAFFGTMYRYWLILTNKTQP